MPVVTHEIAALGGTSHPSARCHRGGFRHVRRDPAGVCRGRPRGSPRPPRRGVRTTDSRPLRGGRRREILDYQFVRNALITALLIGACAPLIPSSSSSGGCPWSVTGSGKARACGGRSAYHRVGAGAHALATRGPRGRGDRDHQARGATPAATSLLALMAGIAIGPSHGISPPGHIGEPDLPSVRIDHGDDPPRPDRLHRPRDRRGRRRHRPPAPLAVRRRAGRGVCPRRPAPVLAHSPPPCRC